jgi:hypothetical protein
MGQDQDQFEVAPSGLEHDPFYWSIYEAGISALATVLFGIIANLNRHGKTAYMSRAWLAKRMGKSTPQISRLIGELKRAGFLEVEQQNSRGRHGTNIYRARYPSCKNATHRGSKVIHGGGATADQKCATNHRSRSSTTREVPPPSSASASSVLDNPLAVDLPKRSTPKKSTPRKGTLADPERRAFDEIIHVKIADLFPRMIVSKSSRPGSSVS